MIGLNPKEGVFDRVEKRRLVTPRRRSVESGSDSNLQLLPGVPRGKYLGINRLLLGPLSPQANQASISRLLRYTKYKRHTSATPLGACPPRSAKRKPAPP
jgi:hypothetical protein